VFNLLLMKEFRGVWIATVSNIDWPSAPGLTAQKQQGQLLAYFDLFQNIGINAVVFQVRPCCDAFYPSEIEPWSEFLTGVQGQHPGYDPLRFALEAAKARKMELHVWLNPFRARAGQRLSPPAPNHVKSTKEHLVKDYGEFQWLDPGEEETAQHTLAVVRDLARRYELDGIHIDDYFYPYRVPGLQFPDDASWSKYGAGPLSRDDWRRDNVNRFVESLWLTIKAENPKVKFGISPFGIWRPGHPLGISGLDQFVELYADARLWLQKGWLDYFTPQLYWKIEAPAQSFPRLLAWWQEQNIQNRAIWPGLFTSKIFDKTPWPVDEITRQIEITRERGANGHIHFSAKALRDPKMQAALKAIYK
jgi:uncharacterized lipoprotein YddW (UPF0748 family)